MDHFPHFLFFQLNSFRVLANMQLSWYVCVCVRWMSRSVASY